MPITVRCNACENTLNIPDKFAGKTVNCPACKEPLKVPSPTTGPKPRPVVGTEKKMQATPAPQAAKPVPPSTQPVKGKTGKNKAIASGTGKQKQVKPEAKVRERKTKEKKPLTKADQVKRKAQMLMGGLMLFILLGVALSAYLLTPTIPPKQPLDVIPAQCTLLAKVKLSEVFEVEEMPKILSHCIPQFDRMMEGLKTGGLAPDNINEIYFATEAGKAFALLKKGETGALPWIALAFTKNPVNLKTVEDGFIKMGLSPSAANLANKIPGIACDSFTCALFPDGMVVLGEKVLVYSASKLLGEETNANSLTNNSQLMSLAAPGSHQEMFWLAYSVEAESRGTVQGFVPEFFSFKGREINGILMGGGVEKGPVFTCALAMVMSSPSVARAEGDTLKQDVIDNYGSIMENAGFDRKNLKISDQDNVIRVVAKVSGEPLSIIFKIYDLLPAEKKEAPVEEGKEPEKAAEATKEQKPVTDKQAEPTKAKEEKAEPRKNAAPTDAAKTKPAAEETKPKKAAPPEEAAAKAEDKKTEPEPVAKKIEEKK
jgi:hypothetical protein